jgi:hypothetical protein
VPLKRKGFELDTNIVAGRDVTDVGGADLDFRFKAHPEGHEGEQRLGSLND